MKFEDKYNEIMNEKVSDMLVEAEIHYNPKKFEPYMKKELGLKFPPYPKQGDVTRDGEKVGAISNFNGFMVYSKSLLKDIQKVEKKFKLGIWNPDDDLTMEAVEDTEAGE